MFKVLGEPRQPATAASRNSAVKANNERRTAGANTNSEEKRIRPHNELEGLIAFAPKI